MDHSADEPTPASRATRVRQLRLVLHTDDFDRALAFYRDALGLPAEAAYEGEGEARVVILDAGRATLEIANTGQVELIDRVETDGTAPSDRVRVAFEVDDTGRATSDLVDAGASLEAAGRETPWRSLNARLRDPDGHQLTLFQELATAEERAATDGFVRPE